LREDSAQGASSPRGAAPVAVRADHFALLHLVEDRLPSLPRELGPDRERLVANVVELEHDWIALPAAETRMVLKNLSRFVVRASVILRFDSAAWSM
jgi:hypothetical protein